MNPNQPDIPDDLKSAQQLPIDIDIYENLSEDSQFQKISVIGKARDSSSAYLGILVSIPNTSKPVLIGATMLPSHAAIVKHLSRFGFTLPSDTTPKEFITQLNLEAESKPLLVYSREGFHQVVFGGKNHPAFVTNHQVIGGVETLGLVMLDKPSYSHPVTPSRPAQRRLQKFLDRQPYLVLGTLTALSSIVSAAFHLPTFKALLIGGKPSEAEDLMQLCESTWGPPHNSGTRPSAASQIERDDLAREGIPVTIAVHEKDHQKALKAVNAIQALGPRTILGIAPASFLYAAKEMGLNHEEGIHSIAIGPEGIYLGMDEDKRNALSGRLTNFIRKHPGAIGPYFAERVITNFSKIQQRIPGLLASYPARIAGPVDVNTLGAVERGILDQHVVLAITGRIAIAAELLPFKEDRLIALLALFFAKWRQRFESQNADPDEVAFSATKAALIYLSPRGVDVESWKQPGHGQSPLYLQNNREHGPLFLVDPRALEAAIAGKSSLELVLASLSSRGLLISNPNNGGKYLVRMPKGTNVDRRNFYAIKQSALTQER